MRELLFRGYRITIDKVDSFAYSTQAYQANIYLNDKYIERIILNNEDETINRAKKMIGYLLANLEHDKSYIGFHEDFRIGDSYYYAKVSNYDKNLRPVEYTYYRIPKEIFLNITKQDLQLSKESLVIKVEDKLDYTEEFYVQLHEKFIILCNKQI